MKMILVTAAVLMTGASMYGIVDYNKQSGRPEFKQLYSETPEAVTAPATVAVPEKKAETAPVLLPMKEMKKKDGAPVKKSLKKKKKLGTKSFSRARL